MRSTDRQLGDPGRTVQQYAALATDLVEQSEFAGLTTAARTNLVLQIAQLHLAAHIRRYPGNPTTSTALALRDGSSPISATGIHCPPAPVVVGALAGGSVSADELVETGRRLIGPTGPNGDPR